MFVRCASAPAPAEPAPAPSPAPVTAPAPPSATGTVTVTASALNVRRDPNTDAEALTQVKRGEKLDVLASTDGWTKVRLASGTIGWVSSAHVSSSSAASAPSRTPARKRSGCPADTDFAFLETPTLAFSEIRKPGLIVIDAYVDTKGNVTSTKVVSNTTGDESLAFLAQREIKSAKFSPPIRNCQPKAFIYSYKRTF